MGPICTLRALAGRREARSHRELVPAPLVPNPDGLAFVYVGDFNVDAPVKAKYREAGIGVPAFFGDTLGSYFACLYLDPPLAVVPGREIWGWPKKDAVITFSDNRPLFRATLSLASSPSDALGRIPVLEVVAGEQYVEDLTLDCGDVLYDYLREPVT